MTTGYNPSTRLTGNFTLETWLRTTHGDLAEFLGTATFATGNLFYLYQQSSGELSLFVDGTGGSLRFDGTVAINDGQWHHVAVVNNGGTVSMYVDGVQDVGATLGGGSGTLPIVLTATDFVVGGSSLATAAASNAWVGDLDDVRVWNVARTGTEIANNMGIEIGQATPEIDVTDPNGDGVADGGSHDINPVTPSGSSTYTWSIKNVSPTVPLNLTTITATPVSGCTVNITTNPSSTTVAAGGSTNLGIQVTGSAGFGTLQFTISIGNNDANENPYNITVNGSRGMSGTLTVNNGGGGDYTDLGSFFDDLEDFGVAGALTVEVSDNGSGYTSDASYEIGSDTVGSVFSLDEVLGTSTTNTITIRAASGQSPVINGAGALFELNGFAGNCGLILTAVANITFEGFEFSAGGIAAGCDAGILIWQEETAIPGGPVTIRSNQIHDVGSGNGILAVYNFGTGLDGLVIENNMLWDMGLTIGTFAGGAGDLFTGAICLWRPTATCSVRHNSVFATNTFFAGQTGCCYQNLGGGAALGDMSYNVFYNAISNAPCIKINIGTTASPNPAPPTAGDRNVFWYPSGIMSDVFTSLTNWQSSLGIDANSINQNPVFTSSTAPFDLHLQPSSQAIDLAVGSTVATDIDGDARSFGAAPDSGADEYIGGGPSGPTVNISATDPTAAEATPANQTGAYTITFTPTTTGSITLNFTMSGTGSLTPGTDYDLSTSTAGATVNWTGPGGTITVPTGTASVVITLTPVDDAAAESAESAIMTINSGTGYTLGATLSDTVSIADNDGGVTPTVTITSSGSPAEAGTVTGTFTLTATPNPTTPLSVNVTLSGTASLGPDYLITSSTTVTIPTTGTATVTMTPVDDTTGEASETVI
ncbi:MAG: LamG domain-containing protein, partial [Planctomycetes bacterium]|nr:LamG domain-containing protein [Planctomycetota bacterium]